MITRFTTRASQLCTLSVITAASLAMSITGSAADSVILKNGNTLSGKLTDSDTSGILALTSPEANTPIKIRETSVDRVLFDVTNSQNSTLTESIQLLNGDHFPCSITELNDQSVTFQSDSLGVHTIARDKVAQIRFNTKANKTLYRGPGNDLSAWTTSSEDWKLNNGKLSTTKRTEAAIPIKNLTENYILEFKTDWDEANPHFRVCFSSDTKDADKKSDFYYIDLNSHGLIIFRSRKGRYDTLAQVLANDKIYGQSGLNVAIHVDRKNQKLALYLNGKLIKTLSDAKTPPTGSYIVVKNLQREGVLTQISDIKVSSWSGKVTKDIKSKAEALTKHDLITDLSGSVMTGQVMSLSNTDGKISLNFKAPFAKNDSNIPSSALDLLEFQTPKEAPDLGNPVYHLNLVSGGLVSFSSSQMIDGKLTVNHPILGKVSLPKANLSSVVTMPKPEPEVGAGPEKPEEEKAAN